MKNGFLIINYRDAATTIRLLNNIKDYPNIDQIVVVDNNSQDNSVSLIEATNIKNLVVLSSNVNHGYSAAINIGVKYLASSLGSCRLIISNSDIIIKSSLDLEKIYQALTKDVVVVGPTVNEHGLINHGWHLPTPWQEVILNIPYLGKHYESKHLLYPKTYYQKESSVVEAVSGCFFATTSNFLKQINYFDEGVFLYYEENILATKVKQEHKKIMILNQVTIIHDHSLSIDKSLHRLKKYNILKASQIYFERNYNRANIWQLFFLHLTIFLTRILLFFKYLFF